MRTDASGDLREAKKELRRAVRKRRQALSAAERQTKDAIIIERLKALPSFNRAQNIMAYASLPEEVQLYALINFCRRRGQNILLPALADDGTMTATVLPEGAAIASGGVWQKTGEFFPPEEIEFILVPGVAFTPNGDRLGMGGGYYDRFLPLAKSAKRIALAYDFQVLDTLPTDELDAKVAITLTETSLYRT